MTETPARRWPKTGTVGASISKDVGDHCTTGDPAPAIAAQPYPGETPVIECGCGDCRRTVPIADLIRANPPGLVTPIAPPAAELAAIADDLNAHGGLDENFVAELLRQASDPYADAKRQLGIVDPPPAPVKTTKPITYEEIVAALEKIAPLGPQRLDRVKLTQEQIDAVTASQPHAAPSAEPWHFFGTPVEIVDTVEDSTPYQLEHAKLGGIVEIGPDLTDAEYARLRNDWLHAVERPRAITPITRIVPFGEPFRPLADVLDKQPPAEPRPWWRRALDRIRRPR